MRRTRKPRWSGAIKKKKSKGGESERDWEREGGREVKHYRGKKAELRKRSLKNATNDKRERQRGGQHNTVTAQTEAPRTGKKGEREREKETPKTRGRGEKKTTICIPVSSSKGSTWLCLEMKSGVADSKVGWRFAAVPHCKAAVAQSRL